LTIKKTKKNKIRGEKKIYVSEKVQEKIGDKRNTVYFHGKDVYSKKFKKKISRKSSISLTYALIINSLIIIGLIIVIWIIITIIGTG